MSGSGVLPLRGEQIEVRLSADGKGPLAGLVRPAGGHDYLDLGGLPCGRNGALWALHLVERQGGPAQTLTNNAARFAGWERARVRGSEALVGRWELPEGGEVQVTFRLDEDGQSVRWACACQGVRGAGGASLERVTGQIIHGLGRSAARHAAAARPTSWWSRAWRDAPSRIRRRRCSVTPRCRTAFLRRTPVGSPPSASPTRMMWTVCCWRRSILPARTSASRCRQRRTTAASATPWSTSCRCSRRVHPVSPYPMRARCPMSCWYRRTRGTGSRVRRATGCGRSSSRGVPPARWSRRRGKPHRPVAGRT